ncbi:MAG: MFS transporter, partial [Desulfobulbaceae bacterium]|nr:MFS transporter [Desulfobulbaceae bacterium]
MNTNERHILTTTCFGHFMSHFNMLVFPALVLPLAGFYGMELSQVLALSFWMYLLFGLTALPWGLLSDRFGAKPFLLLFFLGAGVCGIGAAYFIDSPVIFSLFLAGIGLFSGIYHPAGLGLISQGMQRMAMAMGYNGVAGNAGLAVAPLMAGMINYFYGIKAVFLCVGFLNLSGALVMMMLSVDEPPKHSGTVTRDSEGLIRGFIILCVCMMLGGVAYRGASVILPSYFELKDPA